MGPYGYHYIPGYIYYIKLYYIYYIKLYYIYYIKLYYIYYVKLYYIYCIKKKFSVSSIYEIMHYFMKRKINVGVHEFFQKWFHFEDVYLI